MIPVNDAMIYGGFQRDINIYWSLLPVGGSKHSMGTVQLMCNPMNTACVDCEATQSGMLLINVYFNAKSIEFYS